MIPVENKTERIDVTIGAMFPFYHMRIPVSHRRDDPVFRSKKIQFKADRYTHQ